MGWIELSAVLEMSISERLRLVEAIWDSIAEHPEALPLPDTEGEELDRRWAAYVKGPTAGALGLRSKRVADCACYAYLEQKQRLTQKPAFLNRRQSWNPMLRYDSPCIAKCVQRLVNW
jgi:putative addiction module component (TIGR02574 family)